MITIKRALFAALALFACALPVQAASVFWSQNVTAGGGASCGNGTFKWDADSGTAGAAHKCWATTTGGATAAALPGSADIATFDGASGGGTVTAAQPNNGAGAAQVNVAGLTCGAFTGTLDFATNNNNVTLGSSGFNCSGAGTRTLNLGSGTFTISSGVSAWTTATTTGLTFNAGTSTIQFTAANCSNTFAGGALTYNNVTVGCTTGTMNFGTNAVTTTLATLTVNPGNNIFWTSGSTHTVTALAATGSLSSPIGFYTNSGVTAATLNSASNQTLNAISVLGPLVFGGGGTWTANDSFNSGHNTGITVNPPSGASGGGSSASGVPGTVL